MEEDIVYKYTESVIKQIVKKDDEQTKQMIKDYVREKYPNEKVRIDFYDEEMIDKIIDLGINALKNEKTVHTCLHCGNDTPLYCENCYQELIGKNAELQLKNEKIKTRIHYKVDKCERKLKNNISGLKRLLLETKMGTLKDILYEEYYTSDKPHKTTLETLKNDNEKLQSENKELIEEKLENAEKYLKLHDDYQQLKNDSIPKQVIRDKIEELKAKYNLGDDYWQYDYDVDMNTIDILKELLGE